MFTRFDHAVVGVRDLDAAVVLWRNVLGFDVQLGGKHTGRGTYNAIVRFGLDYVELISIYDHAEIEARGEPNALALAALLERDVGGLLGFALASDDLAGDALRLRRAGLDIAGPTPMERRRPDGHLLQWRLAVPATGSWGRPLPFFIEWDVPDGERLRWEQPGKHANGAAAITALAIAVSSIDAWLETYAGQIGLPLVGRAPVPDLAAEQARFRIGDTSLDLLAPVGPGLLEEALRIHGEQPWQLTMGVRDLGTAARSFAQHGVELLRAAGTPQGLLIPPQAALQTRIVLVETG